MPEGTCRLACVYPPASSPPQKSPHAFLADPTKALPLECRADHLEIAAAGAGDVRLVETGLAPRDDTRAGGKTKTVYHAKASRLDTQAVLDLELIPIAANSPTFTLLLYGQQLAKTAEAINLLTATAWLRSKIIFQSRPLGDVIEARGWRPAGAGRIIRRRRHLAYDGDG